MDTIIKQIDGVVAPQPNDEVFKPESTPAPSGKAHIKDGVQYNALGLESTADHKHVSKVWQDKCTPFPTYFDKVIALKQGKVDMTVPQSQVRFDKDLRLNDGKQFIESGLVSLAQKFTDYPSSSVRFDINEEDKTPDEITFDRLVCATRLNRGLDKNNKEWKKNHDEERKFLLRLRPEGDEQAVRFVGSDRYGIVDNDQLLQMICDSLPNEGLGKALTSHAGANIDRMYGNILIPDQMKSYPDSDYGVGIAFSNSEVGIRVAKVKPFLFRAICLNGCIWGRKNSKFEIHKKHIGDIDMTVLADRIHDVIHAALTEGNGLLEQMQNGFDVPVPENMIPTLIAYLTRENGLTFEQAKIWFQAFRVEPFESASGVVNALTRAAQFYEGETRWNMESLASVILTPSLTASKDAMQTQWQKLMGFAKDKVTEKDLEHVTVVRA